METASELSVHKVHDMISPFDKFNDKHVLQNLIVMHIPKQFFGQNATVFGDMIDSPQKKFLFAMANIIHNPRIGSNLKTQNKTEDHLYFQNGIPKYISFLEKLVGKDLKEFVGYRYWGFPLDPTFAIDKGLSDFISFNKYADIESKDTESDSKSRSKKKKKASNPKDDKTYKGHKNIKSIEDLMNNVFRHLNVETNDIDANSLHGDVDPITEPNGKANPYKVLDALNAFRSCEGVCEKQRDYANYFNNVNDTPCIETFKRDFPDRKLVYKLNSVYFSPSEISAFPLPDIIISRLNECKTIIEKAEAEIRTHEDNLRMNPDDIAVSDLLHMKILERQEATLRMHSIITDYSNASKTTIEVSGGLNIEEECAKRNDFMLAAKVNIEIIKDIKSKYDIDSIEYKESTERFLDISIPNFYETFNTSKKVSQVTQDARKWFRDLAIKDKFIENLQVCEDLSLFANVWVAFMVELDKVFSVETNFQPLIISFLSLLSSVRFSWKLRPNVILSGQHAGGKSFILEWLDYVSCPGTVMLVTHLTPQAMNTNKDMSDIYLVVQEMNMRMFGKDERGNDINADPFMKDRLTRQVAVTFSFNKNSEERESQISVSRCMGTSAFASNDRQPADDSPMMSRFLKYRMTSKKREGIDPTEVSFKSKFCDNQSLHDHVRHGLRLAHFYLFLIEKAIESNALGIDVNTDGPRLVVSKVCAELKKMGVSAPPRRQIDMYVDMTRVLTIWSAIQIRVFGELGLQYRQHSDEEGGVNLKQFDIKILRDIRPWLCCTQEQSVFVLTLMESIFVPNFKGQLASAIGGIYNWPPAKNGLVKFKSIIDENNNVTWDHRYVGVEGPQYKQIVSRILERLPEKPSLNDVMDALHGMQNELVSSPNYGWRRKDKDINVDDTSRNSCYDKMEIDESEESQIRRKLDSIDIHDDHSKKQKRTIIITDRTLGNSKIDDIAGSVFQENPEDFEWYSYGEKETIPCVIFEDDAKKRVKRIYIAVALIGVDFSGSLRRAIPLALQHAAEPERKYITGFPYKEIKNKAVPKDIDCGLPTVEEITHHHILDTIVIPQGKDLMVIENKFIYNDLEQKILERRILQDEQKEKNSEFTTFQKRAASILDLPIDDINMMAHWMEAGIDFERDPSVLSALPYIGKLAVWSMRKEEKRYENIREGFIKDYPTSLLEEYRKAKVDVSKAQVKANEAKKDNFENIEESIEGLCYSDILGKKRHIPFDDSLSDQLTKSNLVTFASHMINRSRVAGSKQHPLQKGIDLRAIISSVKNSNRPSITI